MYDYGPNYMGFIIHEINSKTYEIKFFGINYVWKNSLDIEQCTWHLMFYRYYQHVKSIKNGDFVLCDLFITV